MSAEPIRGHSLNSRSLVSETGIELEPRNTVTYICSECSTELNVPLAADADVPESWPCRRCGATAFHEGSTARSNDEAPPERLGKTPFEMLLERRTREDLEQILQERLAYLRARRGRGFEMNTA